MLSPEEWEIVALSLKVSLVAIVGVLPLAFGCAWALARGRFPGRVVLDALVHLPLVLPPVVTGWLLLLAFGAQGFAGRWLGTLGITLMFRWTGAALASAVMALPLMVRAMRLSIEAVDGRLEAAARTLGASRCRWPCRVSWRGWCLALRARWANSARRSRLCPIFRARRRRCRWRFMPPCKCRAARGW